MAKLVHLLRDEAGLPPTFTLDACRHGGMTELEEAELTDGQGRAPARPRSTAWLAPSSTTTSSERCTLTRTFLHSVAPAAASPSPARPSTLKSRISRTPAFGRCCRRQASPMGPGPFSTRC